MPASILPALSKFQRVGAPPTAVSFRSPGASPSARAILSSSLLLPSVSDSTPILAPRRSAKLLIEDFAISQSGGRRTTPATMRIDPPLVASMRVASGPPKVICNAPARVCAVISALVSPTARLASMPSSLKYPLRSAIQYGIAKITRAATADFTVSAARAGAAPRPGIMVTSASRPNDLASMDALPR